MSPVPVAAAALREDGVEYAFAEEYDGPLITGKLPRALPINVDRIPVAAVVSKLPDKLSLPIVQPILASSMTKNSKFVASETSVSPTSVIAFESQDSGPIVDESIGIELAPGSEIATVSLSLVNASGEVSSSSYSEKPTGTYESGEFSGRIGLTTAVDTSSISHDHCCELLNGLGSSGSLAFSESFQQSRELSRSSRKSLNSNGYKESLDFNHDWASNESVLSMYYPSSRVSSLKIGECSNESEIDNKRDPVVTFREIESSEDILEHTGPVTNRSKRERSIKVQKGSCYRCFKGNRFTEKEICVVCNAKYCRNCVLRAMGSMPEGRKCVTCIGFPVDESKRNTLGKSSRILKRLLNDLEIQQIMRSEKSCQVNRLPPDRVYVNSMPLCHEELSILQSCSNPPKKLKPGNYWYDKVSGLWGKEGQKPSHIITPHLNVGPPIKVDASNGNTQVYINGREITKSELRMLQLAGVQCAGNPHFWVNDDGSYQEEGQKNTKGYIWGKAGTKLICAVLSLPVPSKACNNYGHNASNNTISRTNRDQLEQRAIQKLLLIGCSDSGTSTIFKQAKILYKDVPFTDEEREHIKLLIQSNVYGYLGILLEGREKFEEESLNESSKCQCFDELRLMGQNDGNVEKSKYSISERLKSFSDWVLNIMVSGSLESVFPDSGREYEPLIDELWSNAAIQATFERRNELELLPSVASYFLERVVNILRDDYEPSDLDILCAEGVTSSNGLACMDFVFPETTYDENFESCDLQDSLRRYQLITVHGQGIGGNCKWLEMLEDVRIVLFCVSLSDYDQFVIHKDRNRINKMVLSRNFFESIVTHSTFDQMDFLLLLNKFDSFETKIEHVDLTTCEWFDDFNPVMTRSRNVSSNSNVHKAPSLGQIAFHYIAIKFKKLFGSLTNRKLYVSMMNGLDPNSVDQALRYGKEIVKWDEERPNFGLNEYSIYSTEASSLSY